MVKCAIPGGAYPESALGLSGRRELTPEPAPVPPGSGLTGGAILAAGLRLSCELRLPRAFRQTSSVALRACRPGFRHGDDDCRRSNSCPLYGPKLRETGDELRLFPRFEPQPHCALSPSRRRRVAPWRRLCRSAFVDPECQRYAPADFSYQREESRRFPPVDRLALSLWDQPGYFDPCFGSGGSRICRLCSGRK